MSKRFPCILSALFCLFAAGCNDSEAVNSEPVGDHSDTTPDPGTTTPDPGTTTPDPGTTTPDPGTTTPDPGVGDIDDPIEDTTPEPYCGDKSCNGDETTESCAQDCPKRIVCGDGSCDAGETRANCSEDCPAICGDGQCEGDAGENAESCFNDCGEDTPIDEPDPVCGDGVCETPENEASCAEDCVSSTVQLTMDEFNNLKEGTYYFSHDYARALNPSEESVAEALEDFFAFPYPSTLRTDEYGRPNLKGWKLPTDVSEVPVVGPIFNRLLTAIATERAGFAPLGAVYFSASAALGGNTFPKPEETTAEDACFQLINVEPESIHYGERVPVYITSHNASDDKDRLLWAPYTLVMRPVPGVGPVPGDRHVAIINNCLRSNTHFFSQSSRLRAILNKTAPKEINDKTAFYVDQLTNLGVDLNKIRAMTGYETQNVAVEMDQMAAALKGKGHIVTDENGVAVGTWINRTAGKAWVFRGKYVTYNFIEGDYSGSVPDYSGEGQGVIQFDEQGKLKSAGHEETIYYEVVVPAIDMPEGGFPIAVYGHGTGGDASSHSTGWRDEGIVLTSHDVPMAMIGFDACLQGKRTSGSGSEASLYTVMLQNPIVIRESVRQTVNDMLVLYDIIDNHKLVLPNYKSGGPNITFNPEYGLFMGHSQGSQEAGLLLGITDSVKNAFLSAGGGGVAMSMVELKPDFSKLQAPLNTMLNGKTIAQILGMLFNVDDRISYDAFITTQVAQPLMDPVDPLNFSYRFVKDPIAGIGPKNIAQTMGLNDGSTPMTTQMALAASIGLPIVGKKLAETDATRLAGLSTPVDSPVSNNLEINVGGQKTTGGFMQFNYTDSDSNDPHFVIYHMKAAEQAYINFFKSVLEGNPTVSVDSENQEGGETIQCTSSGCKYL